MNSGFGDVWKIPELRRRIGFTMLMLVIYRIGIFVPTPGIDAGRLKDLFEKASATLFGMVNMFSGGALENFSILALGIVPYISVSIIVQLLTHTWKPLEELSKEGETGRRKITKYTRIGTIVLAFAQGMAISTGLESQGVVSSPGWLFRLVTAVTLMAGTAFLMWLGEQITERGIGNGISIIIMAGIVARMPQTLSFTLESQSTGQMTPLAVLGIFVFALVTVAFVSFCERCVRKIPVQYPRRAVGRRMTQASTQHLPLKLNTAGVIPAIFASSFLAFAGMIIMQLTQADFASSNVGWIREVGKGVRSFAALFSPGGATFEVIYAVLIVFFSYFYTAIQFDPNQIADNLKKNGGFVPTVRPGRDTAEFLNRVLARITLWGATYVCVICIAPNLVYDRLGAGTFTYIFGGTAILIVVGVLMDTISQIQSHILARNYDGFMSKSPGKMRGMSRAVSVRGNLIQR